MTEQIRADRRWVEATVTRIERQTASILSIFLSAGIPPYKAGQHVDIRLSAPDGYQAQRSYSIASAPGSAEIELLVERLDDGEVSPYFHDVVQPGDTFEIRGPIGGHFIWNADTTDPVLLLGGGSGIAPLLSMIRHRLNSGTSIPMQLLYSARTWEDVVCREELFSAEATDPEIRVSLAITRGQSGRPADFSRRIDSDIVRSLLTLWDMSFRRAYVCGSNAFVESATSALIASNIPATIIRTERYG